VTHGDGDHAHPNGPGAETSYERHECPRCGERYGNLPQHLRACDGGDR